MSDENEELSPLADPTSVQFDLIEDEGDEEPGMSDDEVDDFLSQAVPPLDEGAGS